MPSISVIVPVYKVEHVLPRCIDSILTQTFCDFELILIDDGGPDRSGEICDAYACKDSRIHVIHQKNSGVSAARNAGISVSRGEFITFVDSDDHIEKDYLESLYNARCDLTICGQEICGENGENLYSMHCSPLFFAERNRIDYPELYKRVVLYSPYCKLFRGEIIREHGILFPQGITWGEDGMFVADYLAYVSSVRLISYSGYRYIKYSASNNLSTKVRPDIMDMISTSREYCIQKIREHAPYAYEDVKEICTEDICFNCAYFVIGLLNSNMEKAEKQAILKRFLENPYVRKIIREPGKYFENDYLIQCAVIGQNTAEGILKKYRFVSVKEKLVHRLFQLYDVLPPCIKKIYRAAKQRVVK